MYFSLAQTAPNLYPHITRRTPETAGPSSGLRSIKYEDNSIHNADVVKYVTFEDAYETYVVILKGNMGFVAFWQMYWYIWINIKFEHKLLGRVNW